MIKKFKTLVLPPKKDLYELLYHFLFLNGCKHQSLNAKTKITTLIVWKAWVKPYLTFPTDLSFFTFYIPAANQNYILKLSTYNFKPLFRVSCSKSNDSDISVNRRNL